jgi:membrane fusion protein (multidrug efflux system)
MNDAKIEVTREVGVASEEPEEHALRPSQRATVRTLRERVRLPLMIGGPLLGVLVAAYYYISGARYQSTDDAYLRAAQVSISSDVSARVIEIDVHDNERVRRGQTLIRLDDHQFRIAARVN